MRRFLSTTKLFAKRKCDAQLSIVVQPTARLRGQYQEEKKFAWPTQSRDFLPYDDSGPGTQNSWWTGAFALAVCNLGSCGAVDLVDDESCGLMYLVAI